MLGIKRYQVIVQLTPIRTTVSRTVVLIHSMICQIAIKRSGVSKTLVASLGLARVPVKLQGFKRSVSEYKLIHATQPINMAKYQNVTTRPYKSMFLLRRTVNQKGFKYTFQGEFSSGGKSSSYFSFFTEL